MNETAMRILTIAEMREAETEAARLAEVWLQSYLEFPTSDSFDGLLMRLREYQTAWMHVCAHRWNDD